MEIQDNLIHHETVIEKGDVKKLWEMYKGTKFEDAQEYEVSEFLDEFIDTCVQKAIG